MHHTIFIGRQTSLITSITHTDWNTFAPMHMENEFVSYPSSVDARWDQLRAGKQTVHLKVLFPAMLVRSESYLWLKNILCYVLFFSLI